VTAIRDVGVPCVPAHAPALLLMRPRSQASVVLLAASAASG